MAAKDVKRNEYVKKNAKKRAKRRKNGLLGFFVAFILIVLCVAAVLCATILFPVKNVTTAGSSIYSSQEILSASGITPDDNIIMLSSKKVIMRIAKNLPESGKITVEKIFPDTVKITVNTAVPKFCFKGDDLFYVADSNMKIIKKTTEQEQCCIFLKLSETGKPELGDVIEFPDKDSQLLERVTAACTEKSIDITGADISTDSDIKLIVSGRILVELGTDADFDYKIDHLAAMLPKMDEAAQGIINLREWKSTNTQAFFRDQKINTADFCVLNE